MFWALLGHVGVPLIVGLAFAGFSLATERGPFTWNIAIDIGTDFTILSIGAVGALFDDPRLIQHFGEKNALIGVTVAVFNVALGSILMLFKRGAARGGEENPPRTASRKAGMAALFVGFFALLLVGAVVGYGYKQPEADAPPQRVSTGQLGVR